MKRIVSVHLAAFKTHCMLLDTPSFLCILRQETLSANPKTASVADVGQYEKVKPRDVHVIRELQMHFGASESGQEHDTVRTLEDSHPSKRDQKHFTLL